MPPIRRNPRRGTRSHRNQNQNQVNLHRRHLPAAARHQILTANRIQHQQHQLRNQPQQPLVVNVLPAELRDAVGRNSIINPTPFTVGPFTDSCNRCRALRFPTERGNFCCHNGKVKLEDNQILRNYPVDFKLLLEGVHPQSSNFFANIRSYNSSVSFASMGAHLTPPARGRGPYVFKLQGQIYHRIGLLNPVNANDNQRVYGQLYILDSNASTNTRMANSANQNCLESTMRLIDTNLRDCNPYAAAYHNLHSIERTYNNTYGNDRSEICMVFRPGPGGDDRRYNAPVGNEIAAIFTTNNDGVPEPGSVVVYPTANDSLRKIAGQLHKFQGTDNFVPFQNNNLTLTDLHALTPLGFPLYELRIKIGCHVSVLKQLHNNADINPGTRLIVVSVSRDVITCTIDNITHVDIYRANFTTNQQHDVHFTRFQFPLLLDPVLQTINFMNSNLDPMAYPLLFPRGEKGWHTDMKHDELYSTAVRNKTTMLQFYSYRLSIRNEFSALHHSRNLFQQYAVDCWVRTESNNLTFIRKNQDLFRRVRLSGLEDHVLNNDNAHSPGVPVILPGTFNNSPQYKQNNYQDCMAMCRKFGKPDLFITFTCNPKHPDIMNSIFQGQSASDRADIVTRIFSIQKKELVDLITIDKAFGGSIAQVHTIEFQKRGLPHVHLLLWLNAVSKIRTVEDIDSIISAELPDPDEDPELYEIVSHNMIHGPCGIRNPNAPCTENGRCTKEFPKAFIDHTVLSANGYPQYKRPDNGRFVTKGHMPLDNRFVVPYNRYLSLRFKSHINVEACTSIKSIKYLFKYIYKGYDAASIQATVNGINPQDEIKKYIEARYVSAPEAFWRLFKFDMHDKSHTVYRLPVHLPRENIVYYPVNANPADYANRNHTTELTGWFELNARDPASRQYFYIDIPEKYSWSSNAKKWVGRQRQLANGKEMIARMYFVSPRDRSRYFLRMLLLHVRGAESYDQLRTVDGTVHPTNEDACRALHLLIDDTEWDRTLNDASVMGMPSQLRQLFVTILANCNPSNPVTLFNDHKDSMIEDYMHNNPHMSIEQATLYALHDIDQNLIHNYRISLTTFGLAVPDTLPALINDPNTTGSSRDLFDDMLEAEVNIENMNEEQRTLCDLIINDMQAGITTAHPRLHFVDAPGGSGKTYLFNALISHTRGIGCQVAACAWTGIAACLLHDGITVHALFKLPVPVLNNSVANVPPNSPRAELLRNLSLLLVDEAAMIPCNALNAIDKMLQDITGNHIPFGGKLCVFGGDFRQTLPIVASRGASKCEILESCLNRSQSWQYFNQHRLTTNMRAGGENVEEFRNWLLQLGEGTLQSISPNALPGQVDIPNACNLTNNIVDAMFPDFDIDRRDHIILTPKNDNSLSLNGHIMDKYPGIEKLYLSYDSAINDEDGFRAAGNYPLEFLNSLTPSGMPEHKLALKIGCPIMLLRNLDTRRGLCNGVRLRVTGLFPRLISAVVLTGSNIGTNVLLPRIKLAPSNTNLPFTLERVQFPVRLAFAMTINKAQGQTFDKVGIYLPEPVFTHGQLYVAFSRAKCFEDITVCIEPHALQSHSQTEGYFTMNIVYDL